MHPLEHHYNSNQEFLDSEKNKLLKQRFAAEQNYSIGGLANLNMRIPTFLNSVYNVLESHVSFQEALNEDAANAAEHDPFASTHFAADHEYTKHIAEAKRNGPQREPPAIERYMKDEARNLREIKRFANRAVACAKNHAENNVPFIKEFATTTVDRLYKREDPGKSKTQTFLKKFTWFGSTRKPRKQQLKSLDRAISSYKEGIIDFIAHNQEQAITNPESIKEHGLEELMLTIGKILNQIKEEKSEKEYQLGESRLESLCNKMCDVLGKTPEELMQLANPTQEEAAPDPYKPHHQKPHSH